MNIQVKVNGQDIAEALCIDRHAAMETIKEIDLAVADWDFTEQLVVDLITSMKSDVNDVEPLDRAIELIKGCNL